MTTTERTNTTERTTVSTADRRYASEEPIAIDDEVSDLASYRTGKRRGLGEALEAVRYVGYTIGKQEAEDELGAARHDLQEVDVTVPAVVGLTVDGQRWNLEDGAITRMHFCKRCGILCNDESAFENIACDDDDDEFVVDAANGEKTPVGAASDTC